MRVFYHSAVVNTELVAGTGFRAVPCKAYLELQKEKGEPECDIILNEVIIDSNTDCVECNVEAELVICQHGKKYSYSVKPLVHQLSNKYALAFEQFSYEYGDKSENEIESIKTGFLKMYAVDQSTVIHDWTEIFEKIENAFPAFKAICDKPKSHLKTINEVRPIEMVKRIGYESIPYLAAHSEDWLARTASGLKPARLFSRVEEDEYQIYENRVSKTLIDLIISFLRKKKKELEDQYERLKGIINSKVQTGSFGFDVSFQKAVAELLISDDKGDEYRSIVFESVDKLHEKAICLLKKYMRLRQTRLYRYLKKSKAVTNPLNKTNILLMDKHYSVVFKLWKEIHKEIAPQEVLEENVVDFQFTYSDYLLFCKTLCGYTAHVLNFDIVEDGEYYRAGDNLGFTIKEDGGLIYCVLRDKTKRNLHVSNNLLIPIVAGSKANGFFYDGSILHWEPDISNENIENFCSKFKTRGSRGKEQAEERKNYNALKRAIDQRQRECPAPQRNEFVIWPAVVELEDNNWNAFKDYAVTRAHTIAEEKNVPYVIVALPRCDENEQKITEYAKYEDEKVLILPLTMYDINSFRRLQNILIRQIIALDRGKCPCCGGETRELESQLVCDNCNQLTLTKTICPNSECRQEYYYLNYDISTDTIQKMQNVEPENFYQWDSLYQYKDIVEMCIKTGKLRTVCPCCKNA